MSTQYGRPPSPGGRRVVVPGRTSAGSFFTPSPYDNMRPTSQYLPVTRTSGDRTEAPRVVPIRQRSPPRRARDDDFAVRLRRMSLDPGDGGSRRPLSTIAPRSPNRNPRPIVTKEVDRSSSPLAKSSKPGVQLEASYIIPASTSTGRHHHRHSSLTTGDRLQPLDREPKERVYPSSNFSSGRTIAPRLPNARENDDRDYEYTGPRKEFEREFAPPPPRPRDRRESYGGSRERPTSMIIPDRREPEYRRMSKDVGPPVSTRGFDAIGRSESLRQNNRLREDDSRSYLRDGRDQPQYRDANRSSRRNADEDYVPYPEENTRHNRPRKSTLQDERVDPRPRIRKPDEDRYNPRPREYDQDADRRGEDRMRKPRDRDEARREDDRRRDHDVNRERRVRDDIRDQRDKNDASPSKGGLVGLGAAAAGAAGVGLVAEAARKHHHDDDSGKSKDAQGYLREPDRDRGESSETTSVSGDTRLSDVREGEDREERRRRRRREREREEREYREAKAYDRDETSARPANEGGPLEGPRELTVAVNEPTLREQKSYERRPPGASTLQPRLDRPRRHYPHTEDHSSYSEASSASIANSEDGYGNEIARQPRVVTPSNDDKPAHPPAPPKGILKKAKEKFPEEPNHVREGVAPLDAAKRGIPPEARWTRINRRLVNPEALNAEGVRFEEGPDYVIVLKVLNQEEISRYAQKTHEIREKRRQILGAPPPPPPAVAAAAAGHSDLSEYSERDQDGSYDNEGYNDGDVDGTRHGHHS